MARKPAKAKVTTGKKPAAKAKAAKAPKQTVEQLSDQERQRLLFAHKRKLKPLLESEKQAKAAVTKAYELAKKEGIPKSMLKLAISYESEEGEEKQRLAMVEALTVARMMNVPLGAQLEMFGSGKMKPGEKYFEDGRIAALDDQARKPPSHIADSMTGHWFEGYDVGRKAMNTERGGGFKTLAETAAPATDDGPSMADPPFAAPADHAGAAAVDSLITH